MILYALTMGNEPPTGIPSWLGILVLVAFVAFANALTATTEGHSKQLKVLVPVGVMVFFLMLSVFQKTHVIPASVMKLYKFGHFEADRIVLKQEGCNTLGALDIDVKLGSGGICSADRVFVLSRLGREYYLERSVKRRKVRFPIPSDQVVSWSIQERPKGSKTQKAKYNPNLI